MKKFLKINKKQGQCSSDIHSLRYWYPVFSISPPPRPRQQSSSPAPVQAPRPWLSVHQVPASSGNPNSRIPQAFPPDAKSGDVDRLDRCDCTWASHCPHKGHVTRKTAVKMEGAQWKYLGTVWTGCCGEGFPYVLTPDDFVECMGYSVILLRINHEIRHSRLIRRSSINNVIEQGSTLQPTANTVPVLYS
jgi:hypothetical protein